MRLGLVCKSKCSHRLVVCSARLHIHWQRFTARKRPKVMHLMKAGDLQKHERSLHFQQSREKLTMQMIRKAMQQLPMGMTAKIMWSVCCEIKSVAKKAKHGKYVRNQSAFDSCIENHVHDMMHCHTLYSTHFPLQNVHSGKKSDSY